MYEKGELPYFLYLILIFGHDPCQWFYCYLMINWLLLLLLYRPVFLCCSSAAKPHKPIILLVGLLLYVIWSKRSYFCNSEQRNLVRQCSHTVRQLIRKMTSFHKSLRFVNYCASYGAERIFSLVFLSLLKVLLQNHFM